MDLSSGNGTITPNQQLLPKCHAFNQCRKSQFYVTLLLPKIFISHWKFIKLVLNFRKNLKCKWISFCELTVDWPAKRFWAPKARKVVWWFHWLFTLFNIKLTGIILMFPFQNYKLFYFLMKVPFDCLGPHRDFDMLSFLCVNVRVKKELFLSRRWTM